MSTPTTLVSPARSCLVDSQACSASVKYAGDSSAIYAESIPYSNSKGPASVAEASPHQTCRRRASTTPGVGGATPARFCLSSAATKASSIAGSPACRSSGSRSCATSNTAELLDSLQLGYAHPPTTHAATSSRSIVDQPSTAPVEPLFVVVLFGLSIRAKPTLGYRVLL